MLNDQISPTISLEIGQKLTKAKQRCLGVVGKSVESDHKSGNFALKSISDKNESNISFNFFHFSISFFIKDLKKNIVISENSSE